MKRIVKEKEKNTITEGGDFVKTLRQILPAICITGIVVVILFLLYRGINQYAEDKCWQELNNTAQQMTNEIVAEFEDDVAKLHIMETILQNKGVEDKECLNFLYLDSVLPTTMFSRIDLWYPDNTVLSSDSKRKGTEEFAFDEAAAKGEHMSCRYTDPYTGNETIYYLLPIMEDEKVSAILIGVIDLLEISDRFRPVIYNGKGQMAVIDSADGNFIIDSWHDKFENAYAMETRKRVKGYEDVDLAQAIKNQQTGVIVFESKTTGEPLYMYFTPINMFDWQLVIFAPEDTIFEYLLQLRSYITFVGILMTVLIILYFVWSINTVRLLHQKVVELEENKELLRQISYKDALTSINNRTKYVDDWKALKQKALERIGVAYFDLNGLKKINDSESHDAGDRYIQSAAEVLSEVFLETCYRIGGDEFVVLAVEMDEDEFEKRLVAAKQRMEERNISISVGSCWQATCTNLKEMRKAAEAQMYQEKEEYYLTHDRRQ